MPAPRTIPALPHLPHLPQIVRLLAEFYTHNPRTSPDYLLLLAEACDEICKNPRYHPLPIAATRILAEWLRQHAPDYA